MADYHCGKHLIRTKFEDDRHWFLTQDIAGYLNLPAAELVKSIRYTERRGWTGVPEWISKTGTVKKLKQLRSREADQLLAWLDIYLQPMKEAPVTLPNNIRNVHFRDHQWFMLNDVAPILGLTNTSNVFRKAESITDMDLGILFKGKPRVWIRQDHLEKITDRISAPEFKAWLLKQRRPKLELVPSTAVAVVEPEPQSELRTFDFKGADLRVIDRDGNPWFLARDVCDQLGLTHTTEALKYLYEDEKSNCSPTAVGLKKGGKAPILITESGLYKLIMRSNKPTARAFQHWVTSVVLPAIRKDGGYILGEEKLKDLESEIAEAELVVRTLKMMQNKIGRLQAESIVDKQHIQTLEAELNVLSIAEYVSLKHVYWGRGTKAKVAVRAMKIAKAMNLTIVKQDRTMKDGSIVQVNVYDRKVLDQAVTELGLAA